MNVGLCALVGLGLLLLQATLLAPPLVWWGLDPTLVVVVYLGFTAEPLSGGLLALSLGYLMDLYGGGFVGLHLGVYLVVFLLAGFLGRRFVLSSLLARLWALLLCVASEHLIFGLVAGGYMAEPLTWLELLPAMARGIILTVAAGLLIIWVLERLAGWLVGARMARVP